MSFLTVNDTFDGEIYSVADDMSIDLHSIVPDITQPPEDLKRYYIIVVYILRYTKMRKTNVVKDILYIIISIISASYVNLF